MKKTGDLPQVWILIAVFIVSRIITFLIGLHFNIWALTGYWQYLHTETLRNHLLSGLWYDHAQPPVFNFILGAVLKTGGSESAIIFSMLLKIISLINGLLLFSICKKLVTIPILPLLVSIVYILSPATLIFECELFYTTTISLLLLLSLYYIIRLSFSDSAWNIIGVVSPLVLLCLTRSIYHISWFLILASSLLFYFRKKDYFPKLLIASATGILLVGSWYVKNKMIFGKLTASTWIGMNLARNVFHDNEVQDSGRIEAYEPFSNLHVYRKFIDSGFENKYRGLNDRDLLQEYKTDTNLNLTEVSYIQVSDLYMKASLNHIRAHPADYMKNVLQSSILYFTPATIYPFSITPSEKIKYYDILYSFNLTHFAKSKMQRRVLLTISALPKLAIYLFVFFVFIRNSILFRSIRPWNLFILLTIGFLFGVGSLFEHYENMRFRFETEPLFMILAAQVFSSLYVHRKMKAQPENN